MRARLAKAAFELIASKGISSLRVAAVVERIGVTQGALLHHFKNKDELTIAAIEYALAGELDRSIDLANALKSPSRAQVLETMIEDLRTFFFSENFWVALDVAMDSASENSSLKDGVDRATRTYREPVYARWKDMLAETGLDEANATEIVWMTEALVSGLSMQTTWREISSALESALKRWASLLEKNWCDEAP